MSPRSHTWECRVAFLSTTSHDMNIVGILLAAGHSRRFLHGNKLLHPLPSGRPIAQLAAQNLLAALPQSLAVVRPETPKLQALLRETGLDILICEPDQQEMADSLAAAVRQVMFRSTPPDAIVIALADMPFIRPDTITTLAQHLASGVPIVAPTYQGLRGHPVGFSKRFYAELATLQGDEGARSLLRQHVEAIKLVECDDPGILQDLDTWEDLQRL